MQRQTTFFLPFLDQVVRRYMEPHSPQTNLSDKAYLLQYFPSTFLVFFWETFFLLFLRASSSWAFRKSSRGIVAGWLSVMLYWVSSPLFFFFFLVRKSTV